MTCSRPTDIKETCACSNQTVLNSTITTLACDCKHPTSQVVSAGLQYPSQGQCDCDNYTLGNKTCQCCVPQSVQVVQQQPVCNANQTIQSCQSLGNGAYSCASTKTGFTFTNMTNIPSSSCFCLNQKSCNCCVSDAQYSATRPVCPVERSVSSCSCKNINGTLSCSCANQYFFNTPSIVTYRPQNCACFDSNTNQSLGLNCQCCTTFAELEPAPVCQASETSVNCQTCKYDAPTNTVQCGCTGSHLMSATPVALSGLTFPSSSCQCTVSNGVPSCNCCVSRNIWQFAQPVCNSSQSLEKCACKNTTFTTVAQRNVTTPTNVTKTITCRKTGCSGELCSSDIMASICTWSDRFACYSNATCEYQVATGACGWTNSSTLATCLAKPPVIATTNIKNYQNLTARATTTYNLTQLVNVTTLQNFNVSNNVESCACNSSKINNLTFTGQVNSTQCGADSSNSSTFQCCAATSLIEGTFFGRQSCSSSLDTAQCDCNSSRNATCSCVPLNTQITYRNLILDTSRCTCLNKTTGSGQNCRCCIGKMETLLPRAPSCAVNTTTSQVCDCQEVFTAATNRTNLQCSCRQNVTTLENRTVSVLYNVTKQVNVTYNMTVNVTVPVTVTNTSSNVTTNVTANASVSTNATGNTSSAGNRTNGTTNATASTNATTNATASNATSNATTNATSGNRTNATTNSTSNVTTTSNATTNVTTNTTSTKVIQQVVQVTELRNVTVQEARNETRQVSVTRTQTTLVTLLSSQCTCLQYLSGNRTMNYCTCCVQNPFVCNATSTAAQLGCSCTNVTTVVNKVSVTTRSCNCLRSDNNVQATFPFSLTQCGCNPADNSCQCCLNATQFNSMIPVLTCNA